MKGRKRAALRAALEKYSVYGAKLDRAIDTVMAGGVKEHRFSPSGRRIYTVVGRLGDEFIDPEKPYCSCSHFFFRVMGRKDELCYHLLSYRIAVERGKVDRIELDDEEYGPLVRMIVGDVFDVLDRSSDQRSVKFS